MRVLFGLLAGVVFGVGLLVGGMTDPSKVQGFLDVAGAWDPSLAFVMGGAVALGAIAFARAARRERAWTGGPMEIPRNRTIDARLVAGGALFGVGWGLAGFCPGPALVALGAGMPQAAVFVAAMLVGMVAHDRLFARR